MSERFWSHVIIGAEHECWLWNGWRSGRGYGRVRAQGTKNGAIYAHRVAYELCNGPIPAGLIVRHSCDNRLCCNPKHLLTGTCADNSRDMVTRNRQARGHRMPQAKLTAEIVRAVRASDEMTEVLAEQYGVAPTTLGRARSGQTWRHV